MAQRPGSRPNFLFLLADQYRADAIGAAGNRFVHTPNLDRLARGGVRFSNAYTPQALCTPARASLLTGVYPTTHGLRENVYRIDTAFSLANVRLEPNYASLLRKAGYRTGYLGKWHLGEKDPGLFDHFNGYNSQWPHWLGERDKSEYRADVETSEALAFLEQNRGRPFFLEISYYPPHDPYLPPKRFLDLYQGKAVPHVDYYAACSAVDWNIGRLLDKLDQLGLARNTVVIFTSEHGETFRERPFSANKRVGYDESAKVPWLLRWPRQLPAGLVYEGGVSTIDILPTMLEAAGLPVPVRAEGSSRLANIRLKRTGWTDPVFQQNVTQPRIGGGPHDERMVRFKEWKLIVRKFRAEPPPEMRSRRVELFNLSTDPGETQNLAAGQPEKVREMAGLLRGWGERIGDRLAVEMAASA